ncbi:hypothetical protein B0T10DRAFT_466321 [Thelonectria olida]|uniref:Uncharacterized protein n=1 Tax=Thelonectria olida TaxID=1576542 RepID=A0A9P8VS13_9HYPO|nr:hypothetical protein B0T10DRAFT_466321 [Thelonectria olida]
MSLYDLHNKRALITGGGSGINLELAKALRVKGCAVLIGDVALHSEAAEWLKSTEQHAGPKVVFHRIDVTVRERLVGIFDVFSKVFGGVPEIVVPGAGIYEASSAGFWDDSEDSLHYKLFDVNLMHPIKTTRIAIPKMRQAKKPGIILHLSSITAQKPSVVLPLYSVSKAALSQFVRCMAPLDEMCGIKVVAVAPGIVDTPLFRDHPGAQNHVNLAKDFFLPTDEVVRAMLALLTDARYRAGTVLEVGDIGSWREVQILRDVGPQGRSTLPRAKTEDAISWLGKALIEEERSAVSLKL